MYGRRFKRLTDLMMSTCLLILLLPVSFCIALCIALDSSGGALFLQERVGLWGRKFRLIKFRTMVKNASRLGAGYYFDGEDDPRITCIGRFLRRTSLDEIPQLINVIMGDMSLVGPRPMLPHHYDCLSDEQKRRFLVRPGITGLAQVNGRNTIPWSQRIEMDLDYIERLSLALDLKITFKTAWAVLRGRDVDHTVLPSTIEDFAYTKEGACVDEHKRPVGDS